MPNKTVDMYAFYTGRVVQSFVNGSGEQEIKTADLSRYIDRSAQTITSSTGELKWDYGSGAVKYDTPYFQGALGFFAGVKTELSDIIIETDNEYFTFAAVSMDGKPLKLSEKILLQAMTRCHYKGYATEGDKILSTGEPPHMVLDIKAKITLKNFVARHVAFLDELGYIVRQEEADGENIVIDLAADGFYTLVTAEKAQGHVKQHIKKESIEGEWIFPSEADCFLDSPIDLRYLNEDEAGQSGFVTKDGEFFRLGNGAPVKFWATCCGPGLIAQPKDKIDFVAKKLAKMGVNMVRMHGPVYDRKSSDPSVITDEYLDSFHYFVNTMKKQGIYVKLSIYWTAWLPMKNEYGFDGFTGKYENKGAGCLFFFDEKLQAIYKKWCERLMLTKNPYTGLTLAQDPAVAIVEIQNEDSFLWWSFTRELLPEKYMRRIDGYFTAFALGKYGSHEKALEAWGGFKTEHDTDSLFGVMDTAVLTGYDLGKENYDGDPGRKKRGADLLQFYTEFMRDFYADMTGFYKNKIKTKALVSPSNWTVADARLMEGLERYVYTAGDVIDRHGYFEYNHKGETAGWRILPGHTFMDISAVKNPDACILQINAVKGFPHIITETAWPQPNRYKAESVPMWAMYGQLQGMDGIFIFHMSDTDWETNVSNKWPLFVPSVIGQFPAFALMFRNGLLKEGDVVVDVTSYLDGLYNFGGFPLHENFAVDNLNR